MRERRGQQHVVAPVEACQPPCEFVPLQKLRRQRPGGDGSAKRRQHARQEFEIRTPCAAHARLSHHGGDLAEIDVQEGLGERGAIDVGRGFLDLVAEAAQELYRVVHRFYRLRMNVRSDRRGRREADAQAARIALHGLRVGFGRSCDHEGIAGFGATEHIERDGRVAHAARDHAFARRPVPVLAIARPRGYQPARRLQAEKPAACGRNADRAAAVIARRHRHDAGCDGGGGAAARTAGRALDIPGIRGAAEQPRVRDALERQFGQVGLAENHQSRFEVTPHDMGMFGRGDLGEGPAGIARRQAGVVLRAILDQKRNAGERASKRFRQLRAGFAVHQAADRIRLRLRPRALA